MDSIDKNRIDMTIKELKSCVDQCAKKAGQAAATAHVEIWLGDKMYSIKEISQFGVVPDMMITIADVK